MWIRLICILSLTSFAFGFFNDFFKHQFQHHQQPHGMFQTPEDYENQFLNAKCDRYLCPDSGICVDAPKLCPCPYPSSQIRCFLPNGNHLCISKPAGDEFIHIYDDPKTNWKVDAKDDNVRDCGWVNRALKEN